MALGFANLYIQRVEYNAPHRCRKSVTRITVTLHFGPLVSNPVDAERVSFGTFQLDGTGRCPELGVPLVTSLP